MRIAFTGTGGVGKTTLAKKLAAFLDLPFRESQAREVHARWQITEAEQVNLTPDGLAQMQLEIFEANAELLTAPGDFVSDRSLLCTLAYAYQRNGPTIADERYREMHSSLEEFVETLDALIFVPLSTATWTLEDDGHRARNETLRYSHDLLIRGLITEYGWHEAGFFAELSATDPQVRMLELAEIISGLPAEDI